MRKRFSERYGFKKVRDNFQIESMNKELRNRLLNQFRIYYIDNIEKDRYSSFIRNQNDYYFFIKVYDEFLKSSDKPKRTMNMFTLEN